jgi:hypothetical protein
VLGGVDCFALDSAVHNRLNQTERATISILPCSLGILISLYFTGSETEFKWSSAKAKPLQELLELRL